MYNEVEVVQPLHKTSACGYPKSMCVAWGSPVRVCVSCKTLTLSLLKYTTYRHCKHHPCCPLSCWNHDFWVPGLALVSVQEKRWTCFSLVYSGRRLPSLSHLIFSLKNGGKYVSKFNWMIMIASLKLTYKKSVRTIWDMFQKTNLTYFDYPTCYIGLSIIRYPLLRSEDVASWRILNTNQNENCTNKYIFSVYWNY